MRRCPGIQRMILRGRMAAMGGKVPLARFSNSEPAHAKFRAETEPQSRRIRILRRSSRTDSRQERRRKRHYFSCKSGDFESRDVGGGSIGLPQRSQSKLPSDRVSVPRFPLEAIPLLELGLAIRGVRAHAAKPISRGSHAPAPARRTRDLSLASRNRKRRSGGRVTTLAPPAHSVSTTTQVMMILLLPIPLGPGSR